jgi:hypothetical protein
MPTLIDFHSIGRFTEDDLRKSQEEPRDDLEAKVLNKFEVMCNRITRVKMTSRVLVLARQIHNFWRGKTIPVDTQLY